MRRHRAPGEQQLGRPALPNHAGQQRASTHVRPGQTHAGEQKSRLGVGRAVAQVAAQRHHGTRTGTDAVNRANDWLRAIAHGADQVARHPRELQHLWHAHFCERADDLVHVTAAAKVAARAGDHHHLDIGCIFECVEQVTQLGIRIKRERVLALRPVQGDGAHAVCAAMPGKVPGLVRCLGVKLGAHGVACANVVFHAVSIK